MAEASAKRVTGDEPQGTMGRVPPSFARTFSERRLGTRQLKCCIFSLLPEGKIAFKSNEAGTGSELSCTRNKLEKIQNDFGDLHLSSCLYGIG